ncbi:MAG TPA: hypothetical protein VGO67_21505 [Verrucomicrobiae bacterium]|jgi:hypothetical protein
METETKRLSLSRFVRWKFWRNVLVLLAGLVTVYALFCAEENLRGKRAWEAYKSEVEAKGEVLDFRKFVPPPVPDDQNFAAIPFFAQLFDYIPGTHTLRDTNSWTRVGILTSLLPNSVHDLDGGYWRHAKSLDFVDLANKWETTNRSSQNPPAFTTDQTSNAIEFITGKLEPATAVIEEMRKASQRPYSRFNVEYDAEPKFSIILPHLAGINSAYRILALRSCAELQSGGTDAAFADTRLMFRLVHSLQSEPFLVSQLVRAASFGATLQPVWEGLEQRKWSDEQLKELISELRGLDFTGDAMRCLQAEQSFCDTFFEQLRKSRNPMQDISDVVGNDNNFSTPDFPAELLVMLAPSGWFYLEQLNYHKLYYNQTVGVLSPNRVDPDLANERKNPSFGGNSFASAFLKHEEMAKLLLPSLQSFVFKVTRAQTGANLAAIGCALERYRLKHGNYPENLSALAPEYLPAIPKDLIMDQPLKYHLTANGTFILYSVGWNNKDDGGIAVKGNKDMTEGDWVWEYPAASVSR